RCIEIALRALRVEVAARLELATRRAAVAGRAAAATAEFAIARRAATRFTARLEIVARRAALAHLAHHRRSLVEQLDLERLVAHAHRFELLQQRGRQPLGQVDGAEGL